MKVVVRTVAIFLSFAVLAPALSYAGSSMSGTWKGKRSGGELYVRVAGGKAQMKLVGSCSNDWRDIKPADAFVLQGGNLTLSKKQFSVFIGGECTTAKVWAKKSGPGYSFTFRNRWRFTGQVR